MQTEVSLSSQISAFTFDGFRKPSFLHLASYKGATVNQKPVLLRKAKGVNPSPTTCSHTRCAFYKDIRNHMDSGIYHYFVVHHSGYYFIVPVCEEKKCCPVRLEFYLPRGYAHTGSHRGSIIGFPTSFQILRTNLFLGDFGFKAPQESNYTGKEGSFHKS